MRSDKPPQSRYGWPSQSSPQMRPEEKTRDVLELFPTVCLPPHVFTATDETVPGPSPPVSHGSVSAALSHRMKPAKKLPLG